MKIYYAETTRGCALRAAKSLAQARAEFKREVGSKDVHVVRVAMQTDIEWVEAMGGIVPSLCHHRRDHDAVLGDQAQESFGPGSVW
jgi:hypothetical protein